MSLLLWIGAHPWICFFSIIFGAAVLAAALIALVHYVLDPAAHGLARLARRAREVTGRLVRDVREPSGRHRRIGSLPAPHALEVPPRPDGPPPGHVWITPADPHDADTQPIPRAEEAAA